MDRDDARDTVYVAWRPIRAAAGRDRHWRERGAKVARPRGIAAFDFPSGTLLWTETGTQKRATLHLVAGEANLRALDPGGLEVLDSSLDQFAAALHSENHTLKRALTDPRIFSGVQFSGDPIEVRSATCGFQPVTPAK